MQLGIIHFLAENNGGGGLGAVLFFLIWALIAIGSQVQKWREAQRKRQAAIEIGSQVQKWRETQAGRPVPPPMPPQGPAPVRRQQPQFPKLKTRPVPAPKIVLAKMRKPAIPPKAKPLPPKPAPVRTAPSAPVEVDAYETKSPIASQAISGETAKVRHDRPAITANELSRAMRPQMLRRSYILMELLGRPLALREPER